MSRGLFVNALLRETGRPLTPEQAEKFQKFHSEAYLKQVQQVQPLPGAKELLKSLTKSRVKWAIASSGRIGFARPSLDALELPWAWKFYPAAMGRMNWSAPELIASNRIRMTC